MAQTQDVNLSVAGLYTAPNDFSGVPPGALDDALNVAIDQKNLLASRRGFNWFGDELGDQADRTSSFRTTQIAGTATEYELARLRDDTLFRSAGPGETAGSWRAWPGTFPNPASDAKSRFLEVNRRKYILTDAGPKLLIS